MKYPGTRLGRAATVGLGVALAIAIPRAAQADAGSAAAVDTSEPSPTPMAHDSPFLYMLDPSLPAPLQTAVTAGMGNVTRSGEERPIGAGPVMPTVGVELGVISRLSIYADAAIETSEGAGSSPFSLDVGAHVLVTDPTSRTFRVAVQAGYGRDFLGSSTVEMNATVAWDYKIMRIAASLTGSHTFQPGADGVDLGGALAVNFRLPEGFRAGAEFVAADLEEITDPGDEGGASAFVGPTLGWESGRWLQIVGGPAVGVGPGSSSAVVLGRVAATFRF